MNYFPFHIGDYLSATRHLSWEEDLAYRRVLDTYYTNEKPLPAEVKQVCRLVLATTEQQREAVQTILEEFFELTPDGWINRRADAEIVAMQGKQQKQRDRANAMWEKRRATTGTSATHDLNNAPAMPRHEEIYATASNKDANAMPPTPTPTPTPIVKKKNTSAIAPPDGVSDSVWQDFLKIRVAKKAPMTDTALDGIRAEAGIAGIELSEALKICCARGWQGFKAKWLDEKYSSPHGAQGQSGAAWEGAR